MNHNRRAAGEAADQPAAKKKKEVTTTQFSRRLIKEKAEVRQSQGSSQQ
jgi:hypothetical protein